MPNTSPRPPGSPARRTGRAGLDGFVVPISDEHMSEYVGAYAPRLEWLTGFGGSAGTAVVLADQAAIFVDGRYTLQVRDQVDGALYEYQNVPATSPAAWLGSMPARRASAMTHGCTAALGARGRQGAEGQGRRAGARGAQPIDAVWTDRPQPSLAPPCRIRWRWRACPARPSAPRWPKGWPRRAPMRR
jgi:Xaa-Pro aminopeptidase